MSYRYRFAVLFCVSIPSAALLYALTPLSFMQFAVLLVFMPLAMLVSGYVTEKLCRRFLP